MNCSSKMTFSNQNISIYHWVMRWDDISSRITPRTRISKYSIRTAKAVTIPSNCISFVPVRFAELKANQDYFSAIPKQLQSPDDYRLLLCDGHESHISADVVICINHHIDIFLLHPHLLQPFDVRVIAPLKRAILTQISHFIHSGISRIQKVEWLEGFIIAREQGIMRENILSGWRGAGLFPQNMHRIPRQLTDYKHPAVPNTSLPSHTTHPSFFPDSCNPHLSSVYPINPALLKSPIPTSVLHTKLKSVDCAISWRNIKRNR